MVLMVSDSVILFSVRLDANHFEVDRISSMLRTLDEILFGELRYPLMAG